MTLPLAACEPDPRLVSPPPIPGDDPDGVAEQAPAPPAAPPPSATPVSPPGPASVGGAPAPTPTPPPTATPTPSPVPTPSDVTTVTSGQAAENDPTLVASFAVDGLPTGGFLRGGAQWVDGPRGKAVALAGGYVEIPDSAALDRITRSLTVSAFVLRQSSGPGFRMIASRQSGNGLYEHYGFGLIDDALVFVTSESTVRDSVDLPAGRWTHVAVTFDGTTARLYRDGRQVAAAPARGVSAPDGTPLLLGANQNESRVEERFDGQLDEVRVYARALTATELATLAR